MYINNGIYKKISIKWGKTPLPLRAGTPINNGGYPCNDSTAVGLVTQTISKIPVEDEIYILVGGDVSTADVEADSGITLTADAKAAMSGITFYGANGKPDITYIRNAYVLPPATVTEIGGVKMSAAVDDVTDAPTASDFNGLLAALRTAGVIADAVD